MSSVLKHASNGALHGAVNGHRKPTFTKVFRWKPAPGQTAHRVEVVGSFTQWQPVPMCHLNVQDAWQISIDNIQSHRTHHYMLLVDGQPVRDGNCDGLAVPAGPEEARYQFQTPRGPRVLMLFAQTK